MTGPLVGAVVLFLLPDGGTAPAIVVREVDAAQQLVELTVFRPLGYIESATAFRGEQAGNWRWRTP